MAKVSATRGRWQATRRTGVAASDWPLWDMLPGFGTGDSPVGHPPSEAAALGPEGPLGRQADGPTHTLTTPTNHALSRSNGNNCGVAGQDAANGADEAARAERRVTKSGLAGILRRCTVHGPLLNRIGGKLKDNPADGERMGGCGTPMHGPSRVRIKGGVAFMSGIETCKSRLCPMCGSRIAGRRAREFTQAVARWHKRGPDHEVWFVRLSAQNRSGLPLADCVERSAKGFHRLIQRKLWRELRKRYGAHYIKVREETHGINGWNVHLHLAIATRSADSGQVLVDLSIALRRLWPDVMARLGYHADSMHAVHIEQVTPATAEGIGSYMAKETAWDIGSELASGVAKLGRPGHRTYEQIVADYGQSADPADLALIHEYHEVMYGRRHCSWSEGFRELLKMGPEPTDEELAGDDEEPPGDGEPADVAVIAEGPHLAMFYRGQVPHMLTAAERGGLDAIRAYVVGQLGYPPGSVSEPRPDLTRRQPPRSGGRRVDRTDWGDGGREHVGIADVHRDRPVAGCVCEACR